jgi:hypothetical protein
MINLGIAETWAAPVEASSGLLEDADRHLEQGVRP